MNLSPLFISVLGAGGQRHIIAVDKIVEVVEINDEQREAAIRGGMPHAETQATTTAIALITGQTVACQGDFVTIVSNLNIRNSVKAH